MIIVMTPAALFFLSFLNVRFLLRLSLRFRVVFRARQAKDNRELLGNPRNAGRPIDGVQLAGSSMSANKQDSTG